ncbi:hypothetical protein ACU686_26560 [Yinghuangia aomiensis]
MHEAAQVGPTIYALVEEPIDQSLFVCALQRNPVDRHPGPRLGARESGVRGLHRP